MTTTAPIKSTGILEFNALDILSSDEPMHAVLWHKLIEAGFPLNPTLMDWMERPTQIRMQELIREALGRCGAKEIIRTKHPSGTLTFQWR